MVDADTLIDTRNRLIEELIRFIRQLRAADVAVPADGGLAAARALGTVGLTDETRARTALHAALVTDVTDREVFDRLFDEFWHRVRAILDAAITLTGGSSGEVPEDVFAPLGGDAGGHTTTPDGTSTAGEESDAETTTIEDLAAIDDITARDRRVTGDPPNHEGGTDTEGSTATYSPAGPPKPVDLDPTAVIGEDTLHSAVTALGDALGLLPGRRWTSTGARRPDVRQALRTSVTAGGALLPVPEQDRAQTETRATLLVDVSQSVLDTIDRGFLIRFLRVVTASWRRVKVFFFDTAVREVTPNFDTDSAANAVTALEEVEAEWGGGTQIGAALNTIRDAHPDAIDRRTTVFVISDGLEVGDIDALESGIAWVGGRASSVWWLNPLAADQAYEPTVRGMKAALPHIDGLFAFAAPPDVTEIARQLTVRGRRGRVGYAFDHRRTQH